MGRYAFFKKKFVGKCGVSYCEINSGSDVAKEAGAYSKKHIVYFFIISLFIHIASIILLKNDFSSIPVAIELGRLVFDNLKKVILYLMPVCDNPLFKICIPSKKINTGWNLYRIHYGLCKRVFGHAASSKRLPPSLFFHYKRCRHVNLLDVRKT